MVPVLLALQNTNQTDGNMSEIFNKNDMHTEQFQMATEYMLQVDMKITGSQQDTFYVHFNKSSLSLFSSTEIWTLDEKDNTVNMKIAEPKLNFYSYYPELFIVASDFCANN